MSIIFAIAEYIAMTFKKVQALILFLLILKSGYSQSDRYVRFMFYNVENFFDTTDDPLSDDNEFLPDGIMNWNDHRYLQKLESLYKTIIAAGDWEPPAIIAFCEIENRHVLEDLINRTYLSKYNYGIVHEDSPDRRGIDVCMIYRKRIASVIFYKYWIPKISEFDGRSVLYSNILIGSDTVHLIFNHWPSKRGGVLNGFDKRLKISEMIRGKIDSINKGHHKNADMIISGDFNCSPNDEIIKDMISFSDPGKQFINLADSLDDRGLGTYRYMGTWEMIDQVIVSENLLRRIRPITIFRPEFLMKKDNKYPGLSPNSTYRGYHYQGGFSDHLPVLLDLKVR